MTPLGKTMSPTSPISKMSEASPEVGASQLKLRVLKPVYPHPHVVQLPPALKPATLTSCCETWLGSSEPGREPGPLEMNPMNCPAGAVKAPRLVITWPLPPRLHPGGKLPDSKPPLLSFSPFRVPGPLWSPTGGMI